MSKVVTNISQLLSVYWVSAFGDTLFKQSKLKNSNSFQSISSMIHEWNEME